METCCAHSVISSAIFIQLCAGAGASQERPLTYSIRSLRGLAQLQGSHRTQWTWWWRAEFWSSSQISCNHSHPLHKTISVEQQAILASQQEHFSLHPSDYITTPSIHLYLILGLLIISYNHVNILYKPFYSIFTRRTSVFSVCTVCVCIHTFYSFFYIQTPVMLSYWYVGVKFHIWD